jgi:hypothetical protein
MQLRALMRFSYDQRELKPDDEFEAPEVHAQLLVLNGRAAYVTAHLSADPKPEAEPQKGRYRRRDLRADDTPR